MSEFMSALVISGSIFAVMMASQLGRREYSWHKIAIPIVSVGAFGWAYLRHLPTVGNAIWLYLAGIAIGGIFAVLATMTTTIEQDPATKKLFTRTGVAFVITWLVAVALRIGFVWGVDNVRELPGAGRTIHDEPRAGPGFHRAVLRPDGADHGAGARGGAEGSVEPADEGRYQQPPLRQRERHRLTGVPAAEPSSGRAGVRT